MSKPKIKEGERSYEIPLFKYIRKPDDLVVQIQALEARNLAKSDFFGKADPYMAVYVMNEVQPRSKTKVVKKTLSPQWNEMLEVDVENFIRTKRNLSIRCETYDWDKHKVHDFLGLVSISFKDHPDLQQATGKWVELWLPLQKRTSKDKVTGEIHLGIRCQIRNQGASVEAPANMELAPAAAEAQHAEEANKDGRQVEDMQQEVQEKEEERVDALHSIIESENLVDGIQMGQNIMFSINPYSQFGKPIACKEGDVWKADALYQDGTTCTVNMVSKSDGSWQCQFKPTKPGKLMLNISLNGKALKMCPFPMTISDTVEPMKCFAFGEAIDPMQIFTTDTPIEFNVQTCDAEGIPMKIGGNFVYVEVTPELSVAPTVYDNEDGTYTISFTPELPTQHFCNIQVNGISLTDPAMFDVEPVTDPSQCKVAGVDKKPIVGHNYPFLVKAYDKQGNPKKKGGDHFMVQVQDPFQDELPVMMVDNQDGTYICTVLPEDEGLHLITVTLDNMPVETVCVEAIEAADPYKTVVDGPGLKGGDFKTKEGIPIKFRVAPRDFKGKPTKGNNIVQVKIQQMTMDNDVLDTHIPILTESTEEFGVFDISYTPDAPGLYHTIITVDGVECQPFDFYVSDGVDPNNSTISGAKKAYQGIPSRFYVHPRDSANKPCNINSNPFNVRIEDPQGSDVKGVDLAPEPEGDHGVFPCDYTPKECGPHKVEVVVADTNEPIQNSPFEVNVLPASEAPAPENCKILGIKPEGIVGEPFTMDIKMYNVDNEPITTGGDTIVCVAGCEHIPEPIYCDIKDCNNGKYSASFVPTKAGKYLVHPTVNGKKIGTKPIQVTIVDSADSMMPKITGRSFIIQSLDEKGKPIKEVDLEQDKFTVKFFDADETDVKDAIPASIKYLGAGRFKVLYYANTPGAFEMKLLLNGEQCASAKFNFSDM